MRLRSTPQLPPSPPSPYVIRGTADAEIKPPPPPPAKDSSLTHESGQNIASIALSTASNFYQSNLWIFGAFNVPSPPLPSISFKHKVTCSVNSGYIASNASPTVRNYTHPISAFAVHSTSTFFFPVIFRHTVACDESIESLSYFALIWPPLWTRR